jgi:hypothetical protein
MAREGMRKHYRAIVADPVAHAGEAGSIIGAAQEADDARLRSAANEFDSHLTAATWNAVYERCRELGLA